MVFKNNDIKTITKAFIIEGLLLMDCFICIMLHTTTIMVMLMIHIDLEIECMFIIVIVTHAIILDLDGMFPKGTHLGKGDLTLQDPCINGYLK